MKAVIASPVSETTALDGDCRVNRVLSGGFKTILGMPQNFIDVDREQVFLLPPDVRD